MRILTLLLALPMLAGCVGDPPRFAVEPVASSAKINTPARTIAVVNVSLPAYAQETKIIIADEAGALMPLPNADWADEPERAMTFALVRHLSDITGAKVAADPWPLGGMPDAEVRVRVEQMVAAASGTMTLSGQFTIRRDEAESGNRIEQFAINVPAASVAPSDIVRAHDAAWASLAELVARSIAGSGAKVS